VRQRDHRVLRHLVADVQVLDALARQRRKLYEAPTSRTPQMRQRGLHKTKGCVHVDVECLREQRIVAVVEVDHLADAGIADEHVEPAVSMDRRIHPVACRLRVTRFIGVNECIGHALERARLAHAKRKRIASPRQFVCNLAADTARSA
jgi:hypothetical protein